MPRRTKEELLKRMNEIEQTLETLHQDFQDIRGRTKKAVTDGMRARDARKIDDIRKQLGLS